MLSEIINADLHTHDFYSKDSISSPKQVVAQCLENRIHCLAVTNHNTVFGAEETMEEAALRGVDLMVITGEEITTGVKNSAGKTIEVIGLFLKETISPGLTLVETLREIKTQGGIASVPHPFELWRHGSGQEYGEELVRQARELGLPLLWESFNSRASTVNNRQSREFYSRNKHLLLNSAGSDAHHDKEIGRTGLMLRRWGGSNPEEQKQDFLRSIQNPYGVTVDNDWHKTLYYRSLCKIGRLNPLKNSSFPSA